MSLSGYPREVICCCCLFLSSRYFCHPYSTVTLSGEPCHKPLNLLLPAMFAFFSVLLFLFSLSLYATMQITIGVAHKDMERKGSDKNSRLGHNALSWSLYWSGTGFSFWHNDQEKLLGTPKAKRIGIYLDQHAGILNFYRISNNQAFLIHHYETQFTGPLYAGFRLWAGVGDSLTICQLN